MLCLTSPRVAVHLREINLIGAGILRVKNSVRIAAGMQSCASRTPFVQRSCVVAKHSKATTSGLSDHFADLPGVDDSTRNGRTIGCVHGEAPEHLTAE